jgi:hypothetical protein
LNIAKLVPIYMSFVVFGCGEMPAPTPDAGFVVGAECTGLGGCGAGKPNEINVSFCENCFARPDTHVCESGVCRALDTSGRMTFIVGIPPSARGAKSWTQASLNPIRADGIRVTCATALASTDYADNGAYNVGNSNFKVFATSGGADPALAYPSNIAADVGKDRMLVVRVVSDTQGKGQVLGQGCTEGIEIKASETTEVNVIVEAL